MSETFSIEPLGKACGVCVRGFDVNLPLNDAERAALYELYLEHGLILFRDQELTPEQHIAFSRVFGDLDVHPVERIRLAGHPEIIELNYSKLAKPGERSETVGKIVWHSDLTYTVRPSKGALLYARSVPPEGGDTCFADTAAAYDGLSPTMKQRIDGLEVTHIASRGLQGDEGLSEDMKRRIAGLEVIPGAREAKTASGDAQVGANKELNAAAFPFVVHPVAVRHPESGRLALNVGPNYARRIVGLPEEESDALLRELVAEATSPRCTYLHKWRKGDLVLWDNWRTMHMAPGYNARYERVMHRTTLRSEHLMGRMAA